MALALPESICELLRSNLTLKQLATKLDTPISTLRDWQRQLLGTPAKSLQRPVSPWTPEADMRLAELWANPAMRTKLIAQELGVSRNAIIGRARRLNLPARKKHTGPRSYAKKSTAKPHRRATPRSFQPPPMLPPTLPLPPPVPTSVKPLHVPLLGLEERHCRYIVSKCACGLTQYCGLDRRWRYNHKGKKVTDSSYCAYHAQLCILT